MGRKKVNSDELEPTPPPGAEVVHEHSTKWKETAPPPKPEPEPEPEEVTAEVVEEFEEEYVDPWSEFTEEWAAVQGYRMQAVRLADPLPMRDQLRKPCYEPSALPRLPFNPETFISDIQKYAGNSGGYFRVQLLDARGRFIPGASCTGFIVDPPDVPAPIPAPMVAPTAEAPQDEFQGMLKKLVVRRMEKALDALDNPPPPPVIPPALPEAPSVESQLLELAKTDDGLKHKIIDKYFGGDEKSTIVGDILKHPQEALQFVQGVAAVLAGAFRGGVGPNGLPPAPPNPLQQTLIVVIQDLKHNKRVGRAADVIEDLTAKAPQYAEPLSAMLLTEPAQILSQLSQAAGEDLSQFTHAEQWIAELQDELRPDEETGGDAGEGESEGGKWTHARRPRAATRHNPRSAVSPRASTARGLTR